MSAHRDTIPPAGLRAPIDYDGHRARAARLRAETVAGLIRGIAIAMTRGFRAAPRAMEIDPCRS